MARGEATESAPALDGQVHPAREQLFPGERLETEPGRVRRAVTFSGRAISDPQSLEEVIEMEKGLNSSWMALRLAFGLVPIVAGLDKFIGLLTNWQDYLSPLVARLIPLEPATFMKVVGVIEIGVGLAVLTRWTRTGAYVAGVWLLMIAANLVMTGRYFDVAARDVVMSVGAYTLARLDEVRARALAREQGLQPADLSPGEAR
jgi:uncharacterized membrane protein YphA (DoxX/SURF4 family)